MYCGSDNEISTFGNGNIEPVMFPLLTAVTPQYTVFFDLYTILQNCLLCIGFGS